MNKLSIELSENNVGCYVNTSLKNINEEQTLEIKKLLNDRAYLKKILKKGSEKANIIAEENLKNIREKVGLI